MEELIRQAFLHVDIIGPHVQAGHYDLLGPEGEIILPQAWESYIEPDMAITMHMWPMPEASNLPSAGVDEHDRSRQTQSTPPPDSASGTPPLGNRWPSPPATNLPSSGPSGPSAQVPNPGTAVPKARKRRTASAKHVLNWAAGASNKSSGEEGKKGGPAKK